MGDDGVSVVAPPSSVDAVIGVGTVGGVGEPSSVDAVVAGGTVGGVGDSVGPMVGGTCRG